MPKFQETEQAAKDLIKALEPLVKMMDDLAKSIVSVDSVIKKQAKTTEDLTDKEKELKRQADLVSQAEKTAAKAHDLTTEAGKKLTKEQIKLAEARKKAKIEAEKELGITKQSTGFMNKLTGAVQGGIAKFGLMLGAVSGVVIGLKKFLTGVKDSSQFMSDQWDVTMAMGKAAIETFNKALSSPTGFRNFISNLRESMSEARKYAKELDELGELNRELRIEQQKARRELAEQAKIFRSSTASVDEKRAATEKYIEIQRNLAETKEKLTKRAYENEIANLIKGTELTKEQAKAYIENYSALDPMVKKAISFLELQRDLQPDAFTLNPIKGWGNAISSIFGSLSGDTRKGVAELKQLGTELENAGKAGEDAFKLASGYLSFSEEAMNKAGAAAEAYYGSLGEFDEKTLRASLAQDRVNKQVQESNKKTVDEFVKNFQESINKATQIKEQWRQDDYASDLEFLELQKDIEDQLSEYSQQVHKEMLEKEAEETTKGLDEDVQRFQEAEDKKKKILENTQLAISTLGDLESLLSEKKMQDLDAEMNKIQYNRDKEIAAAEKAGKDTSKIKEKYQKQENKLKEKQWKTEHRHAIVQSIINTALAVTALLANPPAAIAAGILGAIETGIIASQEMPKFKEGTKGKLKKATFAEIGDGYKRELVVTPDGSYLSDDKPTKAFLPEGSQVFSGEKTEQMMKENGLSDSLLSQIIVEERLTRKALLDRPEVHNSITSHGMIKYMKIRNMVIHSLKERFS